MRKQKAEDGTVIISGGQPNRATSGQTSGAGGFGPGITVAPNTSTQLLNTTVTPPVGAKYAMVHVSGGWKASANVGSAVIVTLHTTTKYIRLFNSGDATRTPCGSVTFLVDVSGLANGSTAVPFVVSLSVDNGSSASPNTITFNYNIDFIS